MNAQPKKLRYFKHVLLRDADAWLLVGWQFQDNPVYVPSIHGFSITVEWPYAGPPRFPREEQP